jgi:hypothetical protein
MLFGFPLALWGTLRLHEAVHFRDRFAGGGVEVIAAVYVSLLLLYLFRVAFGAVRWLWPFVELRRERQGGLAISARVITGMIFLGLVTAVIYDIVKSLSHGRG